MYFASYVSPPVRVGQNYGIMYKTDSYPKTMDPYVYKTVLWKILRNLFIFNDELHWQNNVSFIYQYVFRKKHSTPLALIDIVDKTKYAIDNNEYALNIMLDITKAFDSIHHEILLSKLEHYGFRGHSLLLLKIY